MVWNDGACIQTNWRNLHLASISWKTTSFHNSAEKKETLRQTAYWWIKLKRLAGKTKKNTRTHTHNKAGLCISINKNRYTRSLSLFLSLWQIFS